MRIIYKELLKSLIKSLIFNQDQSNLILVLIHWPKNSKTQRILHLKVTKYNQNHNKKYQLMKNNLWILNQINKNNKINHTWLNYYPL